MNVIVMGGLGQVGTAISNILNNNRHIVYILDKKDDFRPPLGRKFDFMHVTIPYSDGFLSQVKDAVRKYQPEYVIIHSTVPVGTTRKIGSFCAHSPVRGQHDKLEDGLLKFRKYVGAHIQKTRDAATAHLKSLGLDVEAWNYAEETELMKLLCLSRYLNDLAFYEVAFKTCKKFRVGPSRLVQWTCSYNDGYKDSKWERPELVFPMGKVGGHCVMPVSHMLYSQTRYDWLKKNLAIFTKK